MVSGIEPPFTLLKEQEEAIFGDAVEPSHVALGLVPEVLNPIDVVLSVSKTLRVVYADMVKIRDVKGIITREAVGVDDAVWEGHPLHNRQQDP